MSVDYDVLVKNEGKSVVLHKVAESGDLEEFIGILEKVTPLGIAFREKGKRSIMLLEPEQIEEVADAPAPSAGGPKRLVQRKMRPVDENTAKSHLFIYHAYNRDELEAMSHNDAFEAHELLDHTKLGHKHEEPEVVEESDEDADDE
jgi:hypothetical protein